MTSRPAYEAYSVDDHNEAGVGHHTDDSHQLYHPYRGVSPAPPTSVSPVSAEDRMSPGPGPRPDGLASSHSQRTAYGGADHVGGIAGIALGLAATDERDRAGLAPPPYDAAGPRTPSFSPARNVMPLPLQQQTSYSSSMPLRHPTASSDPEDGSLGSYPSYGAYRPSSAAWDPRTESASLGAFDPNDIEDDGDDGLAPHDGPPRSVPSFGRHSSHGVPGAPVAGTAASAGVAARLGRWFRRRRAPASGVPVGVASGQYGVVPGGGREALGGGDGPVEKSEWLDKQSKGNQKLKWMVGVLVAVLVVGGIVGGVVGGVLGARRGNNANGNGGASSRTPGAKSDASGDLTKDSAEIKALMGNAGLHRVFPGMDYTPLNAQYPDCLTNPPSQNEVTQDVAVLSQLTSRIRLYGTDCNQTAMVLHAIAALDLGAQLKVWLGVWQEKNATTNARQLEAMYAALDQHGSAPFAGVIVGNEVLFRQEMTEAQLGAVLAGVRANLTAKAIHLPVATSDLGSSWTPALAAQVDIVMANVHPFFGGVAADQAAAWTWDFWQQHDVAPTAALANAPRQIISEVGWPSAGGHNCGGGVCASPTSGAVAGIAQMNTFLASFVCQSLQNGTEYFWFEAFDEPWKAHFNQGDQQWEDKWGLLDAQRRLKTGVAIPDCGGKTA
ncbi:MAG: hypothetical protein M1826_000761 [Phylliscum demangeonii]|nr:MAG: hypothetical protein M1826_000761 [Phylliscum demangeonii]